MVERLAVTQAKEPISILLTEVSRMRCEILAQSLTAVQPRLQVVGGAVSVAEAMQLAAELNPTIAVISGNLEDGPLSGFNALRQLHAGWPGMRKIMLLDRCERDGVIAAFRGGARGVFFRAASIAEFTHCIEHVQQGQIWAGNKELHYVIEALSTMVPLRSLEASASGLLTKREREIVKLVGADLANHEISHRLNLSEKTVEMCLFRIFDKLGIHSRVELALLAVDYHGDTAKRRQSGYSVAA